MSETSATIEDASIEAATTTPRPKRKLWYAPVADKKTCGAAPRKQHDFIEQRQIVEDFMMFQGQKVKGASEAHGGPPQDQ